jgi:hypothetical protein
VPQKVFLHAACALRICRLEHPNRGWASNDSKSGPSASICAWDASSKFVLSSSA